MAKTKKLRFMVPRGYNGAIIARGAVIEVAEVWADRFIADGTAVEAESKPAKKQGKENDTASKRKNSNG